MAVVYVDDDDWGGIVCAGDDDSRADCVFGGEGAEEVASPVEVDVYWEFLGGGDCRRAVCARF